MNNKTITVVVICSVILMMTVTMISGCTTVTGNTIHTRDLPGKYDKGNN